VLNDARDDRRRAGAKYGPALEVAIVVIGGLAVFVDELASVEAVGLLA
jgi:hypothetical protein